VKITLLLSCLALAVSANAQTAPTVVFTGDNATYGWQQSSSFTANKNWIGAGLQYGDGWNWGFTQDVLNNFQTNVISKHPNFVFIETGLDDVAMETDDMPYGAEWQDATVPLIQMVKMAQAAGIKVILGNIIVGGADGDPYDSFKSNHFNGWLQAFATAENIPIVNFQQALVEGAIARFCTPCSTTPFINYPPTGPPVPTATGYALMTQMAQTAIATYGLMIKSGYLSNVVAVSPIPLDDGGVTADQPNVNQIASGGGIQFIPQAVWSDGVTRPMINAPYGGVQGIWTSSNQKVMGIDQQGFTYAWTAGNTTIRFTTNNGVTFSPWGMTVGSNDLPYPGLPEPVY
jgi:hypothetical protein